MTTTDRPVPTPVHYERVVAGLPRLEGRTIAVTGCTSGTGAVFARTCAELGGRIVALNRPSPRAAASAERLRETGAEVVAIDLDLGSFDSVREAAGDLADACPSGIDILCNNAGVMGLPDSATVDGCDVQMQTNHLSHFLLTSGVWPLLRRAAGERGDVRVVNHSSGARRGPALQAKYLRRNGGHLGGDGFPGLAKWRRYQQSKLANLLFTYALDDRIPDEDAAAGVKVLCAHPGPTDSGLQAKTTDAGATGILDRYIIGSTMKSAHAVEDGALGLLRAALDPDAASGDFYGPKGRGEAGLAVRLPAERDAPAQETLWWESMATTGLTDFFAGR